jgi:hypothetical protein
VNPSFLYYLELTQKSFELIIITYSRKNLPFYCLIIEIQVVDFLFLTLIKMFKTISKYFETNKLSAVHTWYPFSDVFLVSREVEKSLSCRETAKCLAWCHDNRSKLRKLHSTMEFNLRIQEFVELVRADRRLDAVR